MSKRRKNKPVLLFNTEKEDREAYQYVMSSGMNCELLATEGENTPKIISRSQEFTGLKEIRSYVDSWKNNKNRT